MDDLVLNGRKYISSKRASEITGYAKDYIGQLARSGKLDAKRFGRAWYVNEDDLRRHMGSEAVPVSATASLEGTQTGRKKLPHHLFVSASLPKTWSNIQYLRDDEDLFPSILKTKEISEIRESEEIKHALPTSKPLYASDTIQYPANTMSAPNLQDRKARIDMLVDGIRPKSPVMRIAEPVQANIQPQHPVGRIQRPQAKQSGFSGLATALAAFVIVFGSLGLYLVSKSPESYAGQLMAASYYGISDILDNLRISEFLKGGLEAIGGFITLLLQSFGSFLRTGIEFISQFF